MRVLFLTHYFPPEVGAPQSRLDGLTRHLAARGVEVAVHTCPPHYPSGRITPPHRNRLLQRSRSGAVAVARSAVLAAPNQGTARRLAGHASFAASALLTAPLTGPADVVVAETPPLFLAGAAVAYARTKRAPLVLNVADRWPASAVALGVLGPGRALRAAEVLEAFAYRGAAAITAPTRTMARALEDHPSARGRVEWMAPAVDLDRFAAAPPADSAADRPLTVVYAGTIGMAQRIETVVKAARLAGPELVELTIAGDGAGVAAVERAACGAENVRLIGSVAASEVGDLYARADAGLVALRDDPLFLEALPTKLLEIMAAGRPAIVSAQGEAADMVEEEGIGLAVPPEDPRALASAFSTLRRLGPQRLELGRAGRRLAETRFGREASVERWRRLLEQVAGGRARP